MDHVCAWCGSEIGTHGGRLDGGSATNFGMCRACLRQQLGPAPLAVAKLVRARRMHRCGRSLAHIGRVLGVDAPRVEAALRAA
jgi:ribosomal protein S14